MKPGGNRSFAPLLQPLHVLDLACGGGAFLLAAYQVLLDWHLHQYVAIRAQDHPAVIQQRQDGQWQLTQAERTRILLSCIYGLDIDPQAVTVTKLSLWLKWSEGNADLSSTTFPDLSRNIQVGNALIGADFCPNHATDRATAIASAQPFDWHQAFPEILQAGGFDVVIGNPPYIDSEAMSCHFSDWRSYCTQHYRTATGNWDIFCVFIEKAIELCKPQGFTSLVVPNKLASATYARQARQILSQENDLQAIRDYAQVPVFAASVYPLVYVVQKRSSPVSQSIALVAPMPDCPLNPPTLGDLGGNQNLCICEKTIVWETMRDLEQVGQKRSLHLSPSDPQARWMAIDTSQQSDLLMRLQQFPKLETIAHVTGAATVAEAYLIQDLIQNSQTVAVDDLQVVNSGTINRYRFLWGQKPLRYLKQSYPHPVILAKQSQQLPSKRLRQAKTPKIVVAGMTQQLEASLDEAGAILAGKSTSVIYFRDFLTRGETAIDLRYLLGLINSRLMNYYFCCAFSGNQLRGGYLRVGPPQLRQLPICVPELSNDSDRYSYEQIIKLVSQRLALATLGLHTAYSDDSACCRLEAAIDEQVYYLYRLTDAEIEIL
ncbi:MAG: hypothetical protein Kow00121_30870 [Elainellaceae cyanobacterium]